MVDFILVIILIIVLFMVYKQMSCFDELIESIEYPTILIIYDDQYQIAKKYEKYLFTKSLDKPIASKFCDPR